MSIIFLIITILIFLIGIIGIVAPAIPSLPVIWGGVVFYAFFTHFNTIDWHTIIILGIIALIGTLLDFFANIIGAKKFGAGKWGILGAALGMLVGIFFGPLGMIIGTGIGAFVFEYMRDANHVRAMRAGWGTFIGFLFGTFAKIVLAFIMIGFFFTKVF